MKATGSLVSLLLLFQTVDSFLRIYCFVDKPLRCTRTSVRESQIDFTDFNPFDAKKKATSGLVSLRKTRMEELMSLLLPLSLDTEATQSILEENAAFLLEPLEYADAVLDSDSIYSPSMSRSEKFDAYEASMEERISSARHVDVKRVLEALRDFVQTKR